MLSPATWQPRARRRLSGAQAELAAVRRRLMVAIGALAWLTLVAAAGGHGRAGARLVVHHLVGDAGRGRGRAARARLEPASVSADDAAMFGLPRSTVPFAFHVMLYGQPLLPIRFSAMTVWSPCASFLPIRSACQAVLDGLTADFGPGTTDERGFSNVNWPTTERFGLTVVVTDYQCWPLFSRPGV